MSPPPLVGEDEGGGSRQTSRFGGPALPNLDVWRDPPPCPAPTRACARARASAVRVGRGRLSPTPRALHPIALREAAPRSCAAASAFDKARCFWFQRRG